MHKQAASRFPTTRWSLVRTAGTEDPAGRAALEQLCENYWYPLYAFARHKYPTEEAQDLVQGFLLDFRASTCLVIYRQNRKPELHSCRSSVPHVPGTCLECGI